MHNWRSGDLFAIGDDGTITWGEFTALTAGLAERYKKEVLERYCLCLDDGLGFLINFFALLQANKTVVIPPNSQSGLIEDLRANFDHLVTDYEPCRAEGEFSVPNENSRIELFTSGSTGKPKKVVKNFRHLTSEIAVLEKMFGSALGNSLVVGTVSHQHIYGLLFRLLWPLYSGRPFYRKQVPYPEQLAPLAIQHGLLTLISSPAQLTRMPELVRVADLKDSVTEIFSSGGPLPESTAKTFDRQFGRAPIEVLGSTETGGVARRRLVREWSPLMNVEFKIDPDTKALRVRSPFIAEVSSGEWYPMGDTAQAVGTDQFLITGRSDRVVKIEEKRVSLVEIEDKLRASPLVEDCRLTAITNEHKRDLVGAAIVLSKGGVTIIESNGRSALISSLREHLSQFFEEVVLPRRWRVLPQLPTNSQGKVLAAELQQVFSSEDPIVMGEEGNEESIQLQLRIPDDLRFCDGHFSDMPIVPGFVQISWVLRFASKYLCSAEVLSSIDRVKFQRVIQPGAECSLSIARKIGSNRLDYRFFDSEQVYSSGRLTCAEC